MTDSQPQQTQPSFQIEKVFVKDLSLEIPNAPQIWIGERHIGGCDDLYALEREGKLDPLLKAS